MQGKLPFPKWTLVTPVHVYLTEGLTEEGEPKVVAEWSGKCNYSEKSKQVLDKERRLIRLEGSAIMEGDIAPGVDEISGYIEVNNSIKRTIYRSSRPRNPDGSVNHTKLELI